MFTSFVVSMKHSFTDWMNLLIPISSVFYEVSITINTTAFNQEKADRGASTTKNNTRTKRLATV